MRGVIFQAELEANHLMDQSDGMKEIVEWWILKKHMKLFYGLGKLNLTAYNIGPTVLVNDLRKYMPKTRIDSCLVPFTFMNNNEKENIKEVKRDYEI